MRYSESSHESLFNQNVRYFIQLDFNFVAGAENNWFDCR